MVFHVSSPTYADLSLALCAHRTDHRHSGNLLDAKPGQEDHGSSQTQAELDLPLLQSLHHPPSHRRHLLLPQLGGEPAAVQHLLAAVPQRVPAGAVLPPHAAARQQGEVPQGQPELRGAQQPLPAPPALRVLQARLFHQGQRQSFPEHLPEGAHPQLQPTGDGFCTLRSQPGSGAPRERLRARSGRTERPL